MANIKTYLNNIKTAVFGSEVRDSIHDAIQQCYDDASTKDNANMEVKMARGEYENLGKRLDSHSSQIKETTSQLEHITNFVTPDMFGAKGDGISDDNIALKKMHDYANNNNVKVVYSNKQYYLDYPNNIVIKTDVDFGNSTIIFNESRANASDSFFIIQCTNKIDVDLTNEYKQQLINDWKPTNSKINSLSQYPNSYIYIRNDNETLLVRTNGDKVIKQDTAYITEYGIVGNKLIYEFSDITKMVVKTIENNFIKIENGNFVGNGGTNEDISSLTRGYIFCERSKVIFEKLNFTHEEHTTNLSNGYIYVDKCYDITFNNIGLKPRKSTSGSYVINTLACTDLKYNNVVTIGNEEHWGGITGNFIKNAIFDKCNMNRIDVHFGAFDLTVINSNLGLYGVHCTGKGKLLIKNCKFNTTNATRIEENKILTLRIDYGSIWDGDIVIEDVEFKPNPNVDSKLIYSSPGISHNFGCERYVGRNIVINRVNYIYDDINNNVNAFVYTLDRMNGIPIDNVYAPSNITISNVTTTRKKGLLACYLYAPYYYKQFDNPVITIDNVKSFDGKTKQTPFINFSNTSVSNNYLEDSYSPTIYISKCIGGIGIQGGKTKIIIDDSNIAFVDFYEGGNNNRFELTFRNCLFQPYIESGNIIHILGNVVNNVVTFDNCTFDFPVVAGELNATTEGMLRYQIWNNDTIRGRHINTSFTERVINSNVFDNLNPSNPIPHGVFLLGASDSDGKGNGNIDKQIRYSNSFPIKGKWEKGEICYNINSENNFVGWVCIGDNVFKSFGQYVNG